MSTETSDCSRWGNQSRLDGRRKCQPKGGLQPRGKMRRASGGGGNVARDGGLRPLGNPSALRREKEMPTEWWISASGEIGRASGGGGNVDRFGGFRPMGKSIAPRMLAEMSTGRRDFCRWGNRSYGGWRKCRLGRLIAPDAKIWRALGREMSTKTADVHTGGNSRTLTGGTCDGGLHPTGWRKCRLRRRIASDVKI